MTTNGLGPAGSYPPIAEIAASASEHVMSLRDASIRTLLDRAKGHFKQATFMLDQRTPLPGAYWEFLVAYQIVVDVIPRHNMFHTQISESRSSMRFEFKDVAKNVQSSEERFIRIKEIIQNDNKRNGARHSSRPESTGSLASLRPGRPGSAASSGSSRRRDDELMLPDAPTTAPNGRASPAGLPDSPKRKPPVQPKPPSLQQRAVHQNTPVGASPSNLAERFAKLRGPTAPVNTSQSQDFSVKMPSPADYQSSSRPMGPRDMPPPPHDAPTHPPKLPLDTSLAASLPKEPSPTYSPARNLSLPASINPPRSTARSMVGTGGRSNSMASSALSSAPDGAPGSYFPAQPNIPEQPPGRRKSINKPMELQITAEKLYDYIRLYNVLLIDVRNREDFDAGHIFVRSIMCIEPSLLQDGASAEQLMDRLVLSPEEEQAMYDRRDEYDLVVYYDEGTKTNAFLHRYNPKENELALKRLYETLDQFNPEKPLKQAPIFLMGGIDAWADLVGSQALKMSSTVGIVPPGHPGSKAIRRAHAASNVARLNLHRRRRREYVPMDPEEEQKMLEEARKGRSRLEHAVAPEDDDGDGEVTSPYIRTTEEFLRRFPEMEAGEQSMLYPPSRPQPAIQQAAVQPAPAPIPPAPSRPAPSVPRMSYSGVHERQVAHQERGSHPPAYISPGRFINMKLHRTGLINFGVTCYMNSVLQCLAAHQGILSIFISGRYAQDLQRTNFKGTKGILTEAFATLLSNLYKGDVGALRPSSFRRLSATFNATWGIDEQQDAKEFLEFVLDCLHEDLNIAWNKQPLKSLTEAEEATRERLPRKYAAKIEWGRYSHRDLSLIGSMFAGQHASILTCQTCGTTSTTYEAFYSISVEIPSDRACDIRDCLRSYCSAERLSGEEVWRCPRCKRDREAVKKIVITRAPDTLVVHFKRFMASHGMRAQKIRTPVHFPLQAFDLGPYMEPPITPEQEAHVMQTSRDAAAQLTGLHTDPAMNEPYVYNASAVIWHIGSSLTSGHYKANVKDKARGCWVNFNDDRTTDFEPANLRPEHRLQNENAYIVFYEREQVARGAL